MAGEGETFCGNENLKYKIAINVSVKALIRKQDITKQRERKRENKSTWNKNNIIYYITLDA